MFASQSKSPNVPKWVKMSLVFSWRVIIPALTQLLFQFEWTVTDIFCSRWRDEYESSFLIILESLKSHLHLRPKKKKMKQKIYTKGLTETSTNVIQTSKNSFPEFQNFFSLQNPTVRIFFYLLYQWSPTLHSYIIFQPYYGSCFHRSQRFEINFLATHN